MSDFINTPYQRYSQQVANQTNYPTNAYGGFGQQRMPGQPPGQPPMGSQFHSQYPNNSMLMVVNRWQYPSWLGQVKQVSPQQFDAQIADRFNAIFHYLLMQVRISAPFYPASAQQNGANPNEALPIFDNARKIAVCVFLDGANRNVATSIEIGVWAAIIGDMVNRAGGPAYAPIALWEQTLQTNISSYLQFAETVARMDYFEFLKQVSAPYQTQQGMAMGGGMFGQQPQTHQPPYATPNPYSGFQQTNQYGQQPAQQQQNNETTDLLELQYNAQIKNPQQTAQQAAVNTQQVVTPSAERNTNIGIIPQQNNQYQEPSAPMDVYDLVAFMEAQKQEEALRAAQTPAEPTPPVEPVEKQPRIKPSSVIPTNWTSQHTDEKQSVTEGNEVPATGLPSAGYYAMFTNSDGLGDRAYGDPATAQEHVDNAPPAHASFSDLVDDDVFGNGSIVDDEQAINYLNAQEAGIQSEHEQMRQIQEDIANQEAAHLKNVKPLDTLDDVLEKAKQEGHVVKPPRVVQDFELMPSAVRRKLCRDFNLRIPAFIRGRDRLLYISEGDHKEIKLVREGDVDYTAHETEIKTHVFAKWDLDASNVDVAKRTMSAAATQPQFTEEHFAEVLNEKLENVEQDDIDQTLLELIADRNVIEITDVIDGLAAEDDYQSEAIAALVDRGVEQVGTLIDNGIVTYCRFSGTRSVVDTDTEFLIKDLQASTDFTALAMRLEALKQSSPLPLRAIARLMNIFNTKVNQLLEIEFSVGWSVDDAVDEAKELLAELIAHYKDRDETSISEQLLRVYLTAVKHTFCLFNTENSLDEKLVGTYTNITLVPFYSSQYNLSTVEDVGVILPEHHPELYELLNKLNNDIEVIEHKLVLLDNVVLTFVRSLGEDAHFYLVKS